MRRANRNQWQKTAWIVAGLVLIAVVLGIYAKSLSPLQSVRTQAIKIATKKAKVDSVENFYWDRQRTSYLTVAGTTKAKKAVYVVIRQKTGRVSVVAQKAGISQKQAVQQTISAYSPKKIVSVGMSIRAKKFVWDVGYRAKSGKLGYVTYDFNTGDELFAVANL